MGIFSFIKDAGQKLFGGNEAEAAADKAAEIKKQLAAYNVEGVYVQVDDDKVSLSGKVDNLMDKKRAVVIAGNIDGVASVEDLIMVVSKMAAVDTSLNEVIEAQPVELKEDTFYAVKSGDSLSKIAGEVYGDVMKYNVIFEANKPMLTDPDKIYPGQMLIIPELDSE